MFGMLTAVAIGVFTFSHFQAETWNSGLRDAEIQSAKVTDGLDFEDGAEIQQLSKRDAISFVRLAEKCPLRDYDECPTSYLPQPGPIIVIVELRLSEDRKLGMALIGDCLQTSEKTLIDISSKREQMLAILWQSK